VRRLSVFGAGFQAADAAAMAEKQKTELPLATVINNRTSFTTVYT